MRSSPLVTQLVAMCIASAGLAGAQSPPLLTTGVASSFSNQRTSLDRTTGSLSSTVTVTIRNTSDRLLEAPLHAVVTFMPSGGSSLTGLTTSGLQGGLGQAPYQTFYKDLSATIGSALGVGSEVSFDFSFQRPSAATVSYLVAIRGVRNGDPVAIIGGPGSGQQDVAVTFDASGSTDPDGDALTFAWDFGDGITATGAAPQHAFAAPGLYTVTATVSDGRGATGFKQAQVPIAPPGVFALGRTRTLDGSGHPLGAVTVTQSGPEGSSTLLSEAASGFTSLGGAPGDHIWTFAKVGYLTSFRKATLEQGQVKVVSFPWLAALSTTRTALSLLNPTLVKSAAERVTVTMPPGAFEQVESVALTELHGQALPLPLPFGWSPLAAFHLDMPHEAAADVTASVKLLQSVTTPQTLVLVRLDTEAFEWKAQLLLSGTGSDTVAGALRKPGSYAVVLADSLPAGNPPSPVAGQPLTTGVAPAIAAGVTAVGAVDPATNVASLDPAKVTATATVDFTNSTQPLSSGAWFLAEVEETYDLRDGRALKTPDYDTTFYAYQHPGDTLAATATALFPLRPRVLFGSNELAEAHIKVDVLALNQFGGGIISQDGGLLSLSGLQIGVPAGAVGGPSAAEIRLLSTANLARFLGGFQALMAFELNLPALADGTALSLAITQKLAPNSHFVLARCVSSGSESGLQPVQRLRSDALGTVTSVEPPSGPRLPGVTGSGQYILVQVTEPKALIGGLVRKVGGELLAAALVRVAGEPWLSLTNVAGNFFSLAKPGDRIVTGADPADGNSGQATAVLADAGATANVEILTVPTGPRVVVTTPAANDAKASTVTPITVEFSEPILPGTFGAAGIRLRDVAANSDVPGSLDLDLSGRKASLLPVNPLSHATDYEIVVSNTIRDRQNLPIEGSLIFPFKTTLSPVRPAGAQLTIFEPDAIGIPDGLVLPGYDPAQKLSRVVAVGGAGTADPEVPVILVNETTGETATVLSKPDGSFANFINAAEEDFISAVFVNGNGTRVTIPASRQKFDDGRVGLYRGGGILEAENEDRSVEVLVAPGAVPNRTKFTLDLMTVLQLQELLNGTQPEGGGKALAGIRYAEEGGPITAAADLAFELKPGDVPAGVDPATATFALTVPFEANGVKGFMIIDSMEFEPGGAGGSGRLATHSPPFMGLLLRQLNELRAQAPFRDTLVRAKSSGFGSAAGEFSQVSSFLVAVLVAPLTPQKVGGKVVFLRPGETLAEHGGTPVEGAMVRMETGLGVIDAADPGLFRAGEMFAMSDANGLFAITFPTAFSRQVFATHPRFPFQTAASSGIPAGNNVARMTLIFRPPDTGSVTVPDGAAPVLDVIQSPLSATSGTGDDAGAVLAITAIDDVQIDAVTVTRQSFENLQGVPLALDELKDPLDIGAPVQVGAQYRKSVRVRAAQPGRGVIRVSAVDGVGNVTSKDLVIAFGAGGGSAGTKRRLVYAWPPSDSTNIGPGTPVLLRVSPPVTSEMLANRAAWLSSADPAAAEITTVEASSDRRELTVHYRLGAPPVTGLELLFSASEFDQRGGGCSDGSSAVLPEYRITFAKEPVVSIDGTQATSGAGVVMVGAFSYVLDRSDGRESRLLIYQLQPDGKLKMREEVPLGLDFGRANDLVLIPDYPLRALSAAALGFQGGSQTSPAVLEAAAVQAASQAGPVVPAASYVAAVGGNPTTGARLAVFKVNRADGTLSEALGAQSVPLTIGNSVVVKAKWDPPFLAVQEIAAGATSVRLINFNSLMNGFKARLAAPELLDSLPANGVAGRDLDNDGAFVGAGETAPVPGSRDGQIFGTEFTWSPLDPSERISDFDFSAGAGLLGVTFRQVRDGGVTGMMMVLGGSAGFLNEATARVAWHTPEAKRMLLLPQQPFIKTDGSQGQGDLVLVSTIAAPNGSAVMFVVDVTNPAIPQLLGEAQMPPGTGTLNSLVKRTDGLVAASLSNGGVILLDPRRLLEPAVGGMTPAVQRGLPALAGGGHRSFVSDESGIQIAANGGPVQAALTAPLIQIVTFDRTPFSVDALRAGNVGQGSSVGEKMASVLADASVAATGSVFDPDNASHATDSARHHYVLIRAPGVAGETLPLAVAAVDSRGLPFVPEASYMVPGVLGYDKLTARYAILMALNLAKSINFEAGVLQNILQLSVRELLADVIARLHGPTYPTQLVARRLSDEAASPLYNSYLAGPFVLPVRDLTQAQISVLNTPELPRRFLAAASGVWAGLGPDTDDTSLLKPFAATQDETLTVGLALDMDLRTLLGVLQIGAGVASGNLALIFKGAASLVDFGLRRVMLPGVTGYAHVGRPLRPPLIFVPGIMGSQLVDKESPGTTYWLKLLQTSPFNDNAKHLQLGFDGQPAGDGVACLPGNVLEKLGGIIDLTTVDLCGSLLDELGAKLGYRTYDLSQFKTFEKALEPRKEHLENRPDFFYFAYDWRQDNAVGAAKLARYVTMIQSQYPEATTIDFVVHSMGGLIARRFMLDHPGVIGKFISVASPFLGAVKAIHSKRTGDLDDTALNLVVNGDVGPKLVRYNPALDQLFATRAAYGLGFKPIWEGGVDLDGDGFSRGRLGYDAARSFLDDVLFPARTVDGVEEPAPQPMAVNNEVFHTVAQDDWRGANGGTQFFHLVGLQSRALTITALRFSPRLELTTLVPDVALGLPPVDFNESDTIGAEQPILPNGAAPFPADETKALKLTYAAELVRGAGDGTVPLLCATRGSGSDGDLNHADAIVFPVASASEDDDAKVAHVPVLVHAATKRWIGRILSGTFQKSELPAVAISGTPPAAEGSVSTLTATVTPPKGYTGLGNPSIQWDLGDGRIVRGPMAFVGYPDNGTYTVTCTAVYGPATFENAEVPAGTAGLTSRTFTVINAAPQPVVTVGTASPVAGVPVKLTVNPGDPGVGDEWKVEWNFGDGSPLETTQARSLHHSYSAEGSYTVKVTVTDDEGLFATAPNLDVAVGSAIAAAANGRNDGSRDGPVHATVSNPFDDDPAGSLEFAEIVISNVDPSEELVRAFHDDILSIGMVDGSIVRHEAGDASDIGPHAVQIALYRDVVRGAPATESKVRVRAADDSSPVLFTTHYFRGNGESRKFQHSVNVQATGDDVDLRLVWDQLISLNSAQTASMTTPAAAVAQVGAEGAESQAVFTVKEEADEVFRYSAGSAEGAAATPTEEADLFQEFLSYEPAAASVGTPAAAPKEGAIFFPLPEGAMHRATAPSDASRAAAQTAGGEVQVKSGPETPQKAATITESQAATLRTSIQAVFTRTAAEPEVPAEPYKGLFGKFVLNRDDVLVFEQGTGASLWRGAEALTHSAYTKGKSDNDYELLLPLFKDPSRFAGVAVALDPNQADDRESFARCAHYPEFMAGDWYFKMPKGGMLIGADIVDLGPVPDVDDAEVFRVYMDAATHWIYEKPSQAGLPIGGDWADADGFYILPRSPDDKNPLSKPLTPAQIISLALTNTVNDDPALKKELPDISFFPFRREHFQFAVMSIEKPPPFGDDPVGDAGMGRSSLLLKWLLEGAFLPAFGGFNTGLDSTNDLQQRGAVFNRLVARQAEAFLFDPAEWSLYQEYALLSESVDLRVRLRQPPAAEGDMSSGLFGIYTDSHDNKVMKKAGKAAIRAIFAEIMSTTGGRQAALATTPATYAASPARFRSFEHYIADLAKQRLNSLDLGLTAGDIQDFLDAKVANPEGFKRIRSQAGGVDAFLAKAFRTLNLLQEEHADQFATEAELLRTVGKADERRARLLNVDAVESGFQVLGGAPRPGRQEMHGLIGSHQAHYDLVLTLHNRSGQSVGPLSVQLSNPSLTLCSGITLGPQDDSLTVPNPDRGLFFANGKSSLPPYTRSVSEPGVVDFTLTMTGASSALNKKDGNDGIPLQSYFLDLAAFNGSQLAAGAPGRRLYYRGVRLTTDDYNLFKLTQLEQGRILAPFHFAANPVTFSERRNQIMSNIAADILAGHAPPGFTPDDIAAMSEDEALAVYQFDPSISEPFAGVSTADQLMIPVKSFATQPGAPDQRAFLLVLDLPAGNPGIEYARRSITVHDERVKVAINEGEAEVVFLDHLDFERCDVYEVTDADGPFAFELTHVDTFTHTSP